LKSDREIQKNGIRRGHKRAFENAQNCQERTEERLQWKQKKTRPTPIAGDRRAGPGLGGTREKSVESNLAQKGGKN